MHSQSLPQTTSGSSSSSSNDADAPTIAKLLQNFIATTHEANAQSSLQQQQQQHHHHYQQQQPSYQSPSPSPSNYQHGPYAPAHHQATVSSPSLRREATTRTGSGASVVVVPSSPPPASHPSLDHHHHHHHGSLPTKTTQSSSSSSPKRSYCMFVVLVLLVVSVLTLGTVIAYLMSRFRELDTRVKLHDSIHAGDPLLERSLLVGGDQRSVDSVAAATTPLLTRQAPQAANGVRNLLYGGSNKPVALMPTTLTLTTPSAAVARRDGGGGAAAAATTNSDASGASEFDRFLLAGKSTLLSTTATAYSHALTVPGGELEKRSNNGGGGALTANDIAQMLGMEAHHYEFAVWDALAMTSPNGVRVPAEGGISQLSLDMFSSSVCCRVDVNLATCPPADQISTIVYRNAETDEHYLRVLVRNQVYLGKSCVFFWVQRPSVATAAPDDAVSNALVANKT